MDYVKVLTAVLSALTGLVLILAFLKIILEALVGDRKGLIDRIRFKQKEKLIKEADDFIAKDAYADASQVLRKAFYFEKVRGDAELIDKISNHHISVLSRLVLIADKRSRSLPNLAVLEDLLLNRAEMMRAFLEASQNKRSLLRKRGRETPQWAIEEYGKKIAELLDRLNTNTHSLNSLLDELFATLLKKQGDSQLTIH